jgi:hypothetical protein
LDLYFFQTVDNHYDRTVDLHVHPWGLPSHVTLGLCPYIPSFYLSRGEGRFLLLYRVVALMVMFAIGFSGAFNVIVVHMLKK